MLCKLWSWKYLCCLENNDKKKLSTCLVEMKDFSPNILPSASAWTHRQRPCNCAGAGCVYLELFVPKGLKVLSINKQHQDLLDSHQKSKKHLGRGEIMISDHTSRLTAMGSSREEEGNQARIQWFHPASPAFGWPLRTAGQTGRWKPETTEVYTGRRQKAWAWSEKLSIHVTLIVLSCLKRSVSDVTGSSGNVKAMKVFLFLEHITLNLWVMTPYGIAYQTSCILDICIMIPNSNEVAVIA